MSTREFAAPAYAGDLVAWVTECDALGRLLGVGATTVAARIERDRWNVGRPYWVVTRGRFVARLPLMDCPCREGEGRLTPCVRLGDIPDNHWGAGHCHAWHPAKVAAYASAVERPPRLVARSLPRIRYQEVDYVRA